MANKIIVCQTGARHRYLIPQVLEQSGMLYRLYTDTTAYSSLGKFASFLNKYFRAPNSVKRLTRRIPNIPLNKLFTTDRLFVKKLIKGLFKKDSLSLRYLHYTGFAKKCIAWGVGDADCIYSMYIENIEFLKYAKSKGLKIVVDIYETPMTYKYLLEELMK